MNQTEATSLIGDICKALSVHHGQLDVEVRPGNHTTTVTIHAHAADARRLIGRSGMTFMAMKRLFASVGEALRHQLVVLRVVDCGGDKYDLPPFKLSPEWPSGMVFDLVERSVQLLDEEAEMVLESGGDGIECRVIVTKTGPNPRVRRNLRNLQDLFEAVAKANGGTLVVDLEDEGVTA